MTWFSEASKEAQAHDEYQSTHKAKVSHELMGSAAAFAAMKAYESHRAANSKPNNHSKAKEIAAGLAGAFIDREIETKGLDFLDREKAKREARKRAEKAIDDRGY